MTEFKRCSCQVGWSTREAFVDDPDIVPIGLMFLPDEESNNVYYFFNHNTCKSTLAIDSDDFADLMEEPVPSVVKRGEEECEGHCSKKDDLEICSAECRNAPFRRFFVNHLLKKRV